MDHKRKPRRKLTLSRETLRTVTGGFKSTVSCWGSCGSNCYSCGATFCGGCPVVTQDWPSCQPGFCTTDLTLIECGVR